MKTPAILSREPLTVEAGVSKLTKIRLARHPHPVLMKEPAQFWDEIFIANEAYILGEITHPRIRRKLAYEADIHRLFLEYIQGVTLNDLIKSGSTVDDPARTHRLLQAVAETLADMHAGIFCGRPIVHNDLKSMNVIVPDAAREDIVLIDFSHSYFEGSLPPFITDKKNNPTGTAKYFAPEKWDGDFSNGFKGDVFAFGVLAYYASTGKHPFDGDAAQIQKQIQETAPAPPLELAPNVPRNTAAILMNCLEKKPDRRPTMEQVAKYYAETAALFE
ncbi:MAG TPA: protein kinase [Candidatus Sulfotelmatobacter sp.]|jgi:serine/threonine protein kinase|nr:protein kinase [Candidatus Sulfotelmatobacter sp.]